MNRKSSQRSDFEQFQQYYEKYLNEIYGYILTRVQYDQQLAEDLVSEIFMKALEKFDTFSEETGTFKSWIYKIAKNHLIDFFRSNSKKTTVQIEEVSNILTDKTNPKDNTITKVEKEELLIALEELPENKRELVTLKYIMGYSYKEIADITGNDENNIRVSAHRVLKELEKKLYKLNYHPDQ